MYRFNHLLFLKPRPLEFSNQLNNLISLWWGKCWREGLLPNHGIENMENPGWLEERTIFPQEWNQKFLWRRRWYHFLACFCPLRSMVTSLWRNWHHIAAKTCRPLTPEQKIKLKLGRINCYKLSATDKTIWTSWANSRVKLYFQVHFGLWITHNFSLICPEIFCAHEKQTLHWHKINV